MLMPLKIPKMIETIIIIPDMTKMDDSNKISRKCDHPGVVGEKDSCKEEKIKDFLQKIKKVISVN